MTQSGNGDGLIQLTAKDFKTDQEVRWCPGCGDYAILAAVQGFMPELGIPRERIVFVSGIGCAARFPYYMQTYGMHSIHGRAPAIATGLPSSRPDLSVWVVTGDGDALSIGGNHLIHALRRNVNITILLFNNQVYGLTKGQYSPTSPVGQKTGSTPMGSIDNPFNPLSVALGAEATFVARSIDTDRKHLTEVPRVRPPGTEAPPSSRCTRTATSTTTARSTSSGRTRRTASGWSTANPSASAPRARRAFGYARTVPPRLSTWPRRARMRSSSTMRTPTSPRSHSLSAG